MNHAQRSLDRGPPSWEPVACVWYLSIGRSGGRQRAAVSELGRVEEAEDPRHGELRHGEEEGAEQRDRHHEVEVDQQVGAELREALHLSLIHI